MRKVERIDNITNEDKPIELTHALYGSGWNTCEAEVDEEVNRLVYLGNCEVDGDMFVAYTDECIIVYKGHLNNGTY